MHCYSMLYSDTLCLYLPIAEFNHITLWTCTMFTDNPPSSIEMIYIVLLEQASKLA